MKEHHRIRLLLLLLLLILVLGVRALAQAATPAAAVRVAADTSRALRVIVSLELRRMWVVSATGDTLRSAPVAVGSNRRLTEGNRSWNFATPPGIRRVLSAEIEPVWMRPDWAYIELARELKLRLDSVTARQPQILSDGRILSMHGPLIGTSRDSVDFTPWPADRDIIVGGVLYMPPVASAYRAVYGALGRFRLNLGGSIGFHGTPDKASIGRAVTHGCMRLADEDIEWLYLNIPVGTQVFIY